MELDEEQQANLRESFMTGMRKLTPDEGIALLIVFSRVLEMYPGVQSEEPAQP